MKQKYDVIIIGGAAAGLSAAIYAARREMKTLVITKDVGGQALLTADIQNYTGTFCITGPDLMDKFKKQAEKFGAEFEYEEIEKIEKKDEKDFIVKTDNHAHRAKSVIIASGKEPRELGVPGEKKFKGKGVTYCATCDAPLFKDKNVAIVGGGNSAFEAVALTQKIAKKVNLIHHSDKFKAEKILIDSTKKAKNVDMHSFSEVKEIKGKNFVESIIIENNKTDRKSELKTDGIIIEIGFIVDPDPFKDLVKTDDKNQIIIDNKGKTSESGVFAAGDTTNTPYKQIVISAGEGAKAALASFEYLHGAGSVVGDWGKSN